MPKYFTQHAPHIDLRIQAHTPNQGLRPGQLGALHAVLAHASVHDDPAIVCLPTGYGKTSVMMALPLLLQPNRVLVVEPTNALRKQVSSHFRELSTLRRIGAIEPAAASPSVLRHEGRPDGAEAWDALRAFDVVVSTPGSSSPTLSPGAPADLFDLIIFDEAHHAPAETWSAYLGHYGSARFVFLTATPFRRDGRVIPGKLVYRYPVMRAVREGAFDRVSFRPAPVRDALDDTHVDKTIAETAVAQLRADKAAGFDHRIFVRAQSINAARALVPLYTELGVRVEAIDSGISKRHQDKVESRLVEGEIDGIVCVDMFGEGYDFPNLKVAALHAPHRSLVPTIQFIGRFARVDPSTGGATLIAPRSRIQDAKVDLLKEGVDLAQMIDATAIAQLEGNAAERAILDRLQLRRVTESDYDAVSPLSLQLYAHVRVFRCSRTPDFSQVGETIGKELKVAKHWLSEDGWISLLLTLDQNPPNWATSDVLVNLRHDAFLFVYRPDSNLCFVGSTRRTEKLYLGLMETICKAGYRPLSYEESSRARAGLQGMKFFHVGLKNTTLNSQGESYRTLAGPQAERAVTAGDSRAYVQGHYFGSGLDGEQRETIGASSSSRIWSNQRLTVAQFIDWVERLDARLAGASPFSETRLDIVRAAQTLRQLPDKVIAGMWAKSAFKANPRVRYAPTRGGSIVTRRITDLELQGFQTDPSTGSLMFIVVGDDYQVRMRFSVGGGRMVTSMEPDKPLEVEAGADDWTPLEDWLSVVPPVFYAADKSSFEGVNLMAAPSIRVEALAPGDAETLGWNGCDITVEFLPDDRTEATKKKRAALAGRLTVHEHLQRYLEASPGLVALYYDHRTGEAADFIAISTRDSSAVEVAFYHCKSAGGPAGARRVGDVYEVAGQIVKSVFYCDVTTLLTHMEERMHTRYRSPSRFLRGDFAAVQQLLQTTPPTRIEFTVVGVQPGIRLSMVDGHLADLMSYGTNYARQGGAARAYWLVGE